MRGTPSRRTTSASLPRASKTWQQASAEPTASPSGRACDVSRNLCRCSIFLRTSRNIPLLASFLSPIQQLGDSRFMLLRTVQLKEQLRRSPQMQTLGNLVTDESDRCREAFECPVRLGIVAPHRDEDPCGTGVIR